jgi:hypothetical protein
MFLKNQCKKATGRSIFLTKIVKLCFGNWGERKGISVR